MNIKNEVLIRVYVVLFLVVLTGLILMVQTVKIGIVEGEKWRDRGSSLYIPSENSVTKPVRNIVNV